MVSLKEKIKRNRLVIFVIMTIRRLFRKNIIKKARYNRLKIDGLMCGARICINGKENNILIKNPQTNTGLHIFINGNHNCLIIEEGCVLKNLTVWIEDDANEVRIGKNTLICGETKLSCIEGCKIHIGERCMFSDEIDVRTGDSHSILNEKGKRINPSADVCIGDHVWVGHGVTVLKGVSIAKNSILGTKAVVTKSFDEEGVVLAGNPAKIVKENINWDVARLPMEEACNG